MNRIRRCEATESRLCVDVLCALSTFGMGVVV